MRYLWEWVVWLYGEPVTRYFVGMGLLLAVVVVTGLVDPGWVGQVVAGAVGAVGVVSLLSTLGRLPAPSPRERRRG